MSKKNQVVLKLFIATATMLIGSIIYILYRPTSLRMFAWFDAIGLHSCIETLRLVAVGSEKYIPEWIIKSLPFALWVSSSQFYIDAIWGDTKSLSQKFFLWFIPVTAIGAELAQIPHWVSGMFDPKDLLAIVIIIVIDILLLSIINKQGVFSHEERHA